jgi:2-keto-3-deoxy-L-rhamnonate aldolase RhmA
VSGPTHVDGLLVNRVRHDLAAGGYSLGVIHSFVDKPAVMRMIAAAGFDFVMIDLSHTSFSFAALGGLCDMARASGLIPIVRPYDRSPQVANRIQDVGAMGFMYPHVESRSEVDEILSVIKYPPLGHRGATGRGGPSTDYRKSGEMSGTELKEFVNDNTLLAIQIESKEAVERIDELLEGGGVDVAEIGRNDLATSYGHPYEIRHPEVLEAVDRVIAAAVRHGVTPGAGCYSDEDAGDMVARGMRYLTYSNDRNILNDAYTRGHELLRGLVAAREIGEE